MFSFPLHIFLEVKLLDHIVILFLICLVFCILFFTVVVKFKVHKDSLFVPPLHQAFLSFFFLMATLTGRRCYRSQCGLICVSLLTNDVHFFHVPVDCSYIGFSKLSVQVFYPFWEVGLLVFVLWNCRCLCILDINPLIRCMVHKYFFPFVVVFSFCGWFLLLCRAF